MRTLPCAKISRCAPRAVVNVNWGCEGPDGEIVMYVKRVGEPDEFAYYPALEVAGGKVVFQFDELLFSKPVGRFQGRILVAGALMGTVQLEYVSDKAIIDAEPY